MEGDLIQRAKRGERDAIAALYEAHADRVYTIVRRLAGDDALAEDWAQESWIRIVRGLESFRGASALGSWIHRIAVNTALESYRSLRRSPVLFGEEEGVERGAAEGADRHLVRMELERAIDALPPRMRQVLVLHDVEGYTHGEIGELLGVSAGTSKSQLFKARAHLRSLLDPAIAGEGERICVT